MEKLTFSIETREYILGAMQNMIDNEIAMRAKICFGTEADFIESRGFFKGVIDGLINVVKFYYNIDTTELCELRDKIYYSTEHGFKIKDIEINTSNFIQHLNSIVV